MVKKFAYTGCDNLEVMAEAKNYNAFLTSLVQANTTKNSRSKKILDFGAGSGTYADLLKKEHIKVDCLEPDRILRSSLKKQGYKTVSKAADLTTESYDIIYSFNVFEHIDDDFGVANQLASSLKKGGTLIVYVPAFQLLYSSMDKKVEHVRRYKLERLRTMAEENNLDITTLHYCDPVGFFAALTYKYIGNKDGSLSVGAVKFYDRYIFPISRVIEFVTRRFFGKNALLIAKKN